MPLIKMSLGIGFAGVKHTNEEYIDDAEWEAMTLAEKDDMLDEMVKDWAYNYIDMGVWVEEA